jgi:multicomponent Na+:H+ antiporter subunit F
VNQWLWASTALLALELPLLCYVCVARRLDALVALQGGATIFALSLITLAEGFHRSSYSILGVVAAVLNFAGGMIFVRFFEHELDPGCVGSTEQLRGAQAAALPPPERG